VDEVFKPMRQTANAREVLAQKKLKKLQRKAKGQNIFKMLMAAKKKMRLNK
jgi:hypothetical protein